MIIKSPEKNHKIFSVLIENQRLSDQVGKLMIGYKNLDHVRVDSNRSKTIEIENDSSLPVVFVPLSPALQEVPLQFGKKTYEIPSKE